MFEKVGLLDREAHRAYRLKVPGERYGFAAAAHAAPLMAGEFAEAGRFYPIFFARDAEGALVPVVLLGLRQGRNLFVDGGAWAAGHYVPAHFRRYPLILADEDAIAIDAAYESPEDGVPLFGPDGANTPALDELIGLVVTFRQEAERTRAFCDRLGELGLLKDVNLQVATADGRNHSFTDLLMVDAARLDTLEDARLVELFRSGEMAWILVHLWSTGAVAGLAARDGA